MSSFGNTPLTMNPDEQKELLKNATPAQKKTAAELGYGFKDHTQYQQQQQRQQKRGAYHDLDRINHIVEQENDAHDYFGGELSKWQKNVTGKQPSKDATALKKHFDDYEYNVLSTVPKGGKRHEALSKSLPGIKKDFLQQGHQFALDKLNERSRSVLDKGLQRIAKGAIGAKDEGGVQAHDDAAFDLINKYVLSEAKFDEKDADAMYDKYLTYAGVEKAESVDAPAVADSAQGDPQAQQQNETVAKEPVDAQEATATKSSAENAREMEAEATKADNSTEAARLIGEWEKQTGSSVKDVDEHYKQKPGLEPTWIKDELGKTEYYEKRAQDFEERNPGKKVPEYYREYGDKYIKRFDKLKPGLSEEGQKWMERTKDRLQFKMETGLRSGEWDESKPDELKEKAYDSHSEAYLEAGLAELPQEDIDKIINVVDRMDMINPDALWESLEVTGEFVSQGEFGKAGRSFLTGASHLAPTKEELGKAAKTVFESMPVLPPVR